MVLWRKLLVFVLVIGALLSIYLLHGAPQVFVSQNFHGMTYSLPNSEANEDDLKTVTTPQSSDTPEWSKMVQPTEPSYSGDHYASENSFPQTSCVDSIRWKVSETSFGPRFLTGIPVLQWQKHISANEYLRLRHYPGAYGWAGVDFQTLAASLSVLNTSANGLMFDNWEQRANRSACIRCAVVGNGGILRGAKRGREIDEHDYVFRTNAAVISGFQEDVGSRTSLYTFSTNTMKNSIYSVGVYKGPPQSDETRYVFLPDHDRDYLLMRAAVTHEPVEKGPEQGEKASTYFGPNVTAEVLKMYHPDFIRYLRNRFLRPLSFTDWYRPSTGAVMLLAALHTCDQVTAYGFMTPDFEKYSDHYYDNSYQPVQFYINHDLRMEMGLWQELHRAGLISLYTGPGERS